MNPKAINRLCTVAETINLIKDNKVLVVAGTEEILKKLPKGSWIGGTIPYFMDEAGGVFSKDKVFVSDFTSYNRNFKIIEYTTNNIKKLTEDRFVHGFSYLLLPGFSEIHQVYALEAETISGLFDAPLIGWIAGIDLDELGKDAPKVVDGQTLKISENKALAMHVELEQDKMAQIEILNLFKQGEGDSIEFETSGFSCKNCKVNGVEVNLAEYIISNKFDTRLPLVADYSGANINISFQEVNLDKKEVIFYAPVKTGVEYKMAQPVNDYIDEFIKIVPSGEHAKNVIMSCNCILNYLYSELEDKKTGEMTGPVTFGEIAYVLVNQTMVYLSVV